MRGDSDSYDFVLLCCGVLLWVLGVGGGWGLKVPPPFLFVNTIEKVIRLCTVLKEKNLSGDCEDRDILWHFSRIYLSICKGHLRPLS